MGDIDYWELLEEQHDHDVVMIWPTQIDLGDKHDCKGTDSCSIRM